MDLLQCAPEWRLLRKRGGSLVACAGALGTSGIGLPSAHPRSPHPRSPLLFPLIAAALLPSVAGGSHGPSSAGGSSCDSPSLAPATSAAQRLASLQDQLVSGPEGRWAAIRGPEWPGVRRTATPGIAGRRRLSRRSPCGGPPACAPFGVQTAPPPLVFLSFSPFAVPSCASAPLACWPFTPLGFRALQHLRVRSE